MGGRAPQPDATILTMLHLRDVEGMTLVNIAKELGVTRNVVVGALRRIDKDVKIHCPPDKHDGTMPPLWWAERDAK